MVNDDGLCRSSSSVTGEPARPFHHQPANGHTAREKDIVEFLFQQGFVFRASALHDGDMVRREAAFHKPLKTRLVAGVYALGLSTAQLPAAIAPTNGSSESMNG